MIQNCDHVDPRLIAKAYFDDAKTNWCLSLSFKAMAVILGILVTVFGVGVPASPWVLATIAALGEVFLWRSEAQRSRGESLLRKVEYSDGLGWSISLIEISDALVRLSSKKRQSIYELAKESFFASSSTTGPRRVLENVQESAWWSKHLSATMAWICAFAFLTILVMAMGSLVITISILNDRPSLDSVSKVVCSVLSLIITLGLIKLGIGYQAFAKKSDEVDRICEDILSTSAEVSPMEGAKTLYEYQMIRMSSPPIPDLLWTIRRESLNKMWTTYRKRQVTELAE